jgi:hypothetical protein
MCEGYNCECLGPDNVTSTPSVYVLAGARTQEIPLGYLTSRRLEIPEFDRERSALVAPGSVGPPAVPR